MIFPRLKSYWTKSLDICPIGHYGLDMATKWAEYKRKQRERAKLEKAAEVEAEPTITDDPHPVFPHLKRYSDRTYDENGLVLFEQKCSLEGCKGIWAASIEIPCPYCGGSGVRRSTTITR